MPATKRAREEIRKMNLLQLRALLAWIFATFPEVRAKSMSKRYKKTRQGKSKNTRKHKSRSNPKAKRAMRLHIREGISLKEAWRRVK